MTEEGKVEIEQEVETFTDELSDESLDWEGGAERRFCNPSACRCGGGCSCRIQDS